MITYLELKEKLKDNKQRVMFALGSLIIFLLGFGTGRGYTAVNPARPSANSNYATKQQKTPQAAEKSLQNSEEKKTSTDPASKDKRTSATDSKPQPGQPCPVKGNISSTSKIYHVKGGAFYNRVAPEQCFNTEAEAKAAGFRKSSR